MLINLLLFHYLSNKKIPITTIVKIGAIIIIVIFNYLIITNLTIIITTNPIHSIFGPIIVIITILRVIIVINITITRVIIRLAIRVIIRIMITTI